MPYHYNNFFHVPEWYEHGFDKSKWIGREIEFRNSIPLIDSNYKHLPQLYKGRVIEIKDRLAIVKVTYQAFLRVKITDTINRNYTSYGAMWNGSHHRTIVKIIDKCLFTEYKGEELYYLLKYSGTRWKSLGPIDRQGHNYNYWKLL